MNTLKKITWAREILEIPDHATIDLIQQNFKQLQKQWHPDLCQDKPTLCHQMTTKINEAYEIVMAYIKQYQYSFTEKEIKRYFTAEEWWQSRFGDDPAWRG